MEISEELRYRMFKLLEQNPGASQREMAVQLGISLGKLNYCLRALMGRGLVKARNFKNSRNKMAYLYLLTPAGAEEKARITYAFLRQRIAEVEALKEEIAAARKAVRSREKS
jgi:EPS-associated MarR family transcriptional regulator